MRVPEILQSNHGECGLACLAMIAAYHGHRRSMREFRTRFNASERGTTLRTLRDQAENLGFKSRALRTELTGLAQIQLPAILHWNLDHFVVLESVGKNGLRIVDPAIGKQWIRLEEASQRYTGVALELMPTVDLRPASPESKVGLLQFLSAFQGLGGSLSAVFMMTLALQVFSLVLPLNIQFTVDHGVRQGDFDIVMVMAVGFALVVMVSTTTDWLRSLLVQYVGNSSVFRMMTSLAHHMFRLSDGWYSSRHTGDVLSRFQSTRPVAEFLMTGIFQMLVDLLMGLGALLILLAYSPRLTLVVFIMFSALATVNIATLGRFRTLTMEMIEANAQEQSSFIEIVDRHRAIKILGAERVRENSWIDRLVNSLNSNARQVRFVAHVDYVGAAIRGLESVVILLFGSGMVIDGKLSMGMLLAFISYSSMFSARAGTLIRSLVQLRMLQVHQERIADIALEPPEDDGEAEGIRLDVGGRVSVRSLGFSYSRNEPEVLQGLDFEVASGEFIALTGGSGSGKSTLIKLLCKLLTAQHGSISIDGVDISTVETRSYRQQLGVVMQDDDLFTGSLMENIAVDLETIDVSRVEKAARTACIHDDILQMPMNYRTLVGPMGSSLSGGQRQRVMIARAVYRNPALFLLDEATAHLDEDLRREVVENLRQTGTTVIAATHDEQVISFADRVINLN